MAPARQRGERDGRRARRGHRPRRARPRCAGRASAIDGRSLAECTARSARPSSTACCTSLHEHALAADGVQRHVGAAVAGGVDEHQLDVDVGVGGRATASATCSACQRASLLCAGGDARGRAGSRQVEQVAQGRGERSPSRRAGRLLQPHGRLVEQLGDDAAGERRRRARRSRSSARLSAGSALELGPAHRLGPLVQRRDERAAWRADGVVDVAARPRRRRCAAPRRPRAARSRRPRSAKSRRSSRSSSVTPCEGGDGGVDVARHADVDDRAAGGRARRGAPRRSRRSR